MSIEIKSATLGLAETNAYLVGDTETDEAILIDPVDQADLLKQMADDAGWTIKLILATHAHFDHVLASQPLKDLTGAPFWISDEAADYLLGVPQTGVLFTGTPFPKPAKPDRLLTNEPETIQRRRDHAGDALHARSRAGTSRASTCAIKGSSSAATRCSPEASGAPT